jgi:hypothetical protein
MQETKLLLERWRNQLERLQSAQYLSAEHCRRINNWLGMPVIACTAIVGSTVFATLSDAFGHSVWLTIALGFMSVTAAVLASLQTFLKYSERAEKHLTANRQFNRLKRQVEFLLAFPPKPEESRSTIANLKTQIDQAMDEAVPPLERVWRRVCPENGEQPLRESDLKSEGPFKP